MSNQKPNNQFLLLNNLFMNFMQSVIIMVALEVDITQHMPRITVNGMNLTIVQSDPVIKVTLQVQEHTFCFTKEKNEIFY